ncbi:MAG: ATP-binding protein [Bacteroidota bacterium]
MHPIYELESEDTVRRLISDNGIGIEPHYQQQIFVIFKRLHRREQFTGNGIGLAHCQKIVDMHGGTISVKSEAGQGSTFYFSIQDQDPD